jgi:hypothetical protein
MLKSVVAGATITPLTQMLAACALSAVIVVALWQSGSGGRGTGGRLRGLHHRDADAGGAASSTCRT